MEYMIIINTDETSPRPGPGEAGFDDMMTEWFAFNQRLIDGGHWIAGANLQPISTATTVRREWGAAPTITDGPYVETKEQFSGFYLVKAADLDEAIELAKAIPIPVGAVEVRPVALRPDAA